MPLQEMLAEFQKRRFKKTHKTGYFQIIALAFWFDVFH